MSQNIRGSDRAKMMTHKQLVLGILLFLGFNDVPRVLAAEDPDELYRKGRFSEAEKAYARADMDHPKDIRYRYNRGCAAYQNSDYQGAKGAFSSVLRRTEDEEVQFKAAYNLGNVAFKEGDFESAIMHYKEALLLNAESKDARFNLELALRELDKLKKKAEEQKKEAQKDSGQQTDKQDQPKSENKGEESDKQQPQAKDQSKDKGEKESDKQKGDQQGKDRKPEEGQKAKQEAPKDLSGQLSTLEDMPEQKEEQLPDQPVASLDRKKAEALLDNLKEDRSRFLRFQIPKSEKRAPSGKDW